ncbi:MAG: ergothioneine biosynthesis protein EgtB [Cytophagales bacterium]|nr:ergothioneine biosynthesis protein EgtB [Cytophagales bacterium]
MTSSQTLTSSSVDIAEKYDSVRTYSETQCESLITEDYIPQPVFYISPPKWHLGHTTWFFEEFILKTYYEGYKVFDAEFSYLFNSYYNTVGNRILRPNRGNLTRPSVEKVYKYRAYVDQHMIRLLNKSSADIFDLVELGLNHEQQHQELFLTDLKYILGHNPLFPVYKKGCNLSGHQNSEHGFLEIEEGKYEIGFQGDGFCYDNELSRHTVFLHDFEISKSMVTNGAFMEFIRDGGYRRFELWLDEGWSWVNEHKITAPKYWHMHDGIWHCYTLAGFIPVAKDDILCHISYHEAAAFAAWKNMRLPTEFEWEAASDFLNWGDRWEWTASAYLPYPGFEKPPGAVGEYNGKFMINQMVLRGASSATSAGHSRKTYRNFFHPHYQWQFSGIRLAKKQKL